MDRNAVNQVAETLNEPGPEGILVPGLADALDRIGVEDLQKHTVGNQAVPLLMLERELSQLVSGGDADLDVFADALTAFVVVCNRSSAELAGRQRIVQAVKEFLARRRLPREVLLSISPNSLTDAQKRDWEQLARRIPWIRWIAHPTLDPSGGVTVSLPELVDFLVLLRPGQAQRYDAEGVISGPVPERFTQLYPVDDWELAPAILDHLDHLADALSPLLHSPARTAQMVQALTLPAALDLAVTARIGEELQHVALDEHLLAIRVDDHESERVLFVNLSPRYALQMHVDGELVTLPPNALEQKGAFGYCSAPQRITTSTSVQLGRRKVSLDTPLVPLAEDTNVTTSTLPPDLFRGREEQLAMLRRAMSGRGPRSGNLIFGTRRAGKSTLMEHVSLDERLRGAISIDVSNTAMSVRDYAAWSRDVSKKLATKVRRQLPGVTIDVPSGDFVDALIDLDDALDGGPPVAVALDELDVLLLPEQGSGGRRAAGRLGNLVFRNLVVMGTVQRFHRAVHEFKNWEMIECPADLDWADGISYFLGPLADLAPGPRVEWLTRAGVTPQLFVREIEPFIGLRPYFWGRLRSNLEAVVGGDSSRSRLISPDVLREKLAELVSQDAHLNAVMDDGASLEPEERRRRDLFSVEERRILLRFALMPDTESTLPVAEALQVGGEAAVKELIDRAYLTYNESHTRLRTAVPIYHKFLRSRVTDLQAVTPDAASLVAPTSRMPSRRDDGSVVAPVATTKPQPTQKSAARTPVTVPPGPVVQPAPTATNPVSTSPTVQKAALPPAIDLSPDIQRARVALLDALKDADPLPLATVGEVIKEAVPEIFETKWAGAGRLTVFLTRFLPEFPHVEGPGGGSLTSVPAVAANAPAAKTVREKVVPDPPALVAKTAPNAKAAPARVAPATSIATAKAPAAKTPAAKAPAAKAPAAKAPAAKAPAAKVPAAKVPAAKVPAAKAPAAKVPAAKAPAAKVPAAKAPAAKAPAAKAPAAKAPAAKAPAAKAPAAKAPAAKVPAAKAPAAKAPAAEVSVPPQQHSDVTAAELKCVRAALRKALDATDALPLGVAGQVIMQAAPRIFATQWAGTGKLTNFFEVFLPEFPLEDGSSERFVRPPPSAGMFRRLLRKISSDSPPS